MFQTLSTCTYCGVGCGVVIESDDGQVVGVRGDPNHPANFGRLCTKGSNLHLSATERVRRDERLHRPLQRSDRQSPHQAVAWDAVLQNLAQRFAEIIEKHGPDSVAFYVSGQLLTEDYYVFNKLAKGLIGTNNIDTNSRLCMSSAVAGYKQSLGADAPPTCYDDVNHADCVFIAGSNTAWAHPVFFRRLEDARAKKPEMKIIVVDPRRTETAEFADLHLQIQPGTDVALFNGMLHVMVWDELLDRDFIRQHTHGFETLKALVRDMTPALAAGICGIEVQALVQAAQWFAQSPATLSLYCQGLNQSSSGTAKNTALINLHLATGQIGRAGAGPFSLTGQPNAMGGREVGGLANLLSSHRDLANPEHRAEVAALWGVPSVPSKPGQTAVELFEAAARGEIKAIWIACTNPAQSMPNQRAVRQGLERCELVVLQEAFAHTATAPFADVILPASAWAEKDGTVTNSERCISRVRPAVPAPGEARADWWIAAEFAHRLQKLIRPDGCDLFPYQSAEDVWQEHRETTRGRDLDITGLSYEILQTRGPQQWPFVATSESAVPQGKTRLYEDGRFATADGRAQFIAQPYRPPAEARDARFPFVLNTGRLRDQWHSMSRTGTTAKLFAHESGPVVRMNPSDLPRRGFNSGDLVKLRSRRGVIVLPLLADERVAPMQIDIPMHWGEEFVSGTTPEGEAYAGVNSLTNGAFCPDSKQPELKYAAVSVERADLPWRLWAAAWVDDGSEATLRQALRPHMKNFGYTACVPVKGLGERIGVMFQAASATAFSPAQVNALAQVLSLKGDKVLSYTDPKRGQRLLRLQSVQSAAEQADDDLHIQGLLLVGYTPLSEGLWNLWLTQSPIPDPRELLRGDGTGSSPIRLAARQVCNCFDVSEPRIRECFAQIKGEPAFRIAALQAQLKCGTQCGSCLPELRRLEREVGFAQG